MRIRKILSFLVILTMMITLGYSSVNKSVNIKEGTKSVESLSSVNGSISIGDNIVVNGSVTNVNGSIRTGEKCEIKSRIRNVNGSVKLGDNSSSLKVSSVNGSIRIGKNVQIKETIRSVNGSIKCDTGTNIKEDVDTVNGSVTLYGTEVFGGIITYNGHLKLKEKSVIHKDIIIKKSKMSFFERLFGKKKKALKITISGNSIVKGDIVNKDKDRDVILEMDKGCKVEGKLINIDKKR